MHGFCGEPADRGAVASLIARVPGGCTALLPKSKSTEFTIEDAMARPEQYNGRPVRSCWRRLRRRLLALRAARNSRLNQRACCSVPYLYITRQGVYGSLSSKAIFSTYWRNRRDT